MDSRRNTVVLIRTVFDYTPTIVEQIQESYAQSCRHSVSIQCRFDPLKQQFVLEGDSMLMEYAFQDFMDINQKISLSELAKHQRGGMKRSPLAQLTAPAIPWSENPKAGRKDDEMSTGMSSGGGRTPRRNLGYEEYPMVEFWEPKVSKEDFNLMLQLNDNPTIPEALSGLADCLVTCDWSRRSVRIAAKDRDTLDRIAKKLRTIEDIFTRKFKPIVAHIVNVEQKPRFQLKMVRLNKQPDRARTTLFETGSKYYEFGPKKMSSVRLLELSSASNGKFTNCRVTIKPVHIAKKGTRAQPREWADYLYLGHEPTHHSLFAHALAPTYNEALPELELDDMICEYHDSTQGPAGFVEGKCSQTLATPGAAELPKRVPRIRAQPVPMDSNTRMSQQRMNTEDSDGETQPMEAYVPGFILDSRPSDAVEEQPQPGLTTRKAKERKVQRKITAPPTQALLTGAPSTHTTSEIYPADFEDDPSLGSFSFGSRPDIAREPDEPAMPTRTPKQRKRKDKAVAAPVGSTAADRSSTASIPSTDGPPTPKTKPDAQPEDHGIGLGPKPNDTFLIEFDTPEVAETRTTRKPKAKKAKAKGVSTWAPSLLDDNEVNTRQKEKTMQQKAPSAVADLKVNKKDHEKLRQFNNHKINQIFVKAFEQARSFEGEVALEAKLGRLLFLNMPREATRHTIEWNEWENFITHETHYSTIFSPALTADHHDAEFVQDLNVNAGMVPLFADGPSSKKVSYEFDCKENGKQRLLVVDAESFEPILYDVSQPFATVYSAHPVQSWDSCLQLSGRKTLRPSQAIKSIVESLAAPENAEPPEIRFSIIQTGGELQVDHILVKREARYPVEAERVTKGIPVELVVTEVQTLSIKQKNRQMHFKAFAKDRQEMKAEGKLWYAFSFVATEVEEAMLQNWEVELGETVQWTTEGIMGGSEGKGFVINALNSVVNSVIRQIDDVGFGNCQIHWDTENVEG